MVTPSDTFRAAGCRRCSTANLNSTCERLSQERGDNTSFFAFADTVVARSYRGTNECHGWMGIKFQSRANDEPSQIVMHVRMLDEEASGQQEALGIVGVNLCYGAFFLSHVPEELIESLLDKLTTARIEIDMLEFSGIEFRNVTTASWHSSSCKWA